MAEPRGSIILSNGPIGCPFMPDLLFNFHLEPKVAWFELKCESGARKLFALRVTPPARKVPMEALKKNSLK